ncbi:beta-1,3-glucan-binding protein-like [Sitophilus oryzae]|uniref:Beta-1,3-glucan-binding protein-like n=1 Tax=Sitophilus oryzae TaxID=7048 RepID=A0A6J2YIW0_SITOR|nr:beta-1,3-glucan-binding protein-like [Sitophilus oryzae]
MVLLEISTIILLLGLSTTVIAQYEVPEATVEVYTPRGFRVSIPDEEGIKLFAFHAKINEEMNGREAGTFSRDITKAKDGRWTFYDTQAKLNVGDILYYWTFVDYFDGTRKLGYVRDDQTFTVTELLPKPGANKPVTTKPVDPNVCVPSATTVKGQAACKGRVIFESQFNNFQEEKSKYWTVTTKFATGPDYEFVVYQDHPKTLSVMNGHLVITPRLTEDIYGKGFINQSTPFDLGEQCTGIRSSPECTQTSQGWYIIAPVVSSQITTKGKFSFKYGKIEIRAKLPKGDWLYPELFLNPEVEEYGKGYESGQIRVAYSAGNADSNKKLEGGAILGGNTAARNYAIKVTERVSPWGDDFHTYTVLWTPDQITLSVDDTTYGRIFPPESGFSSLSSNLRITNANRWKSGTKMAPFDKEMYIMIGVGAGGHNFEDRSDGSKPWKNPAKESQRDFYNAHGTWFSTWGNDAKLEVDYVKIWALYRFTLARSSFGDEATWRRSILRWRSDCGGDTTRYFQTQFRPYSDPRYYAYKGLTSLRVLIVSLSEQKMRLNSVEICIIAVAILVLPHCSNCKRKKQHKLRNKKEIVFFENFNSLDLNVWNYDPNTQEHADEFQLYTNSSNNSYVEDGFLHIRPTIEIDENALNDTSENFHAIRSARISTKNSFYFTYGIVEIRARLPIGDWLFPALWLMPKDNVYDTWPLSGEIDVIEAKGNRNLNDSAGEPIGIGQVGSTLHFGPSKSLDGWRYAHFIKNNDSYYSSDFHTYKLVWTPENITFLVDENSLGTVSPPSGGFFELGKFSSNATNPWVNGTIMAPFDQDFYLIINLAVGGTHFFSDNNINQGGKPWSNNDTDPGLEFWNGKDQWLPTWDLQGNTTHFIVDYVKVWSL